MLIKDNQIMSASFISHQDSVTFTDELDTSGGKETITKHFYNSSKRRPRIRGLLRDCTTLPINRLQH